MKAGVNFSPRSVCHSPQAEAELLSLSENETSARVSITVVAAAGVVAGDAATELLLLLPFFCCCCQGFPPAPRLP